MQCSLGSTMLKMLVRLVLGSSLFFMGWYWIFGTTTLTADQVQLLEGTPSVAIVRTALVDEPTQADTASPTVDLEPKAVANLALTFHEAGLGNASMGLAWGVALLQLIGGAMLVIGLLTRLWAILTLCMFGVLFWTVSVKTAGMFAMDPFDWLLHPLEFQALYLQCFGILAALALLGKGGGKLSVDQFLFGRAPVLVDDEAD